MKDTDKPPNSYSWNPCKTFSQDPGCQNTLVSHFQLDLNSIKQNFAALV